MNVNSFTKIASQVNNLVLHMITDLVEIVQPISCTHKVFFISLLESLQKSPAKSQMFTSSLAPHKFVSY